MSTPYIMPDKLTMLPTGFPWKSLVSANAGTADVYQAQLQLCRDATGWVDNACNQPLRCTADPEVLRAPGPRVGVDSGNVVSIWPTRQPVISVTTLEVRPTQATESDWVTIPSTYYWTLATPGLAEFDAGDGTREIQATGTGITRGWPDGSFLIRLTYLNGWPHGGLTTAGTVGATTLAVDSVLGFATGQTPRIDDGPDYEVVTIQSITTNADGVSGTLTLSAGTQFAHGIGTPVTLLPEVVSTSTGYYAATLAYRKGALAIAAPSVSGSPQVAKPPSASDWEAKARKDLAPFRRDY